MGDDKLIFIEPPNKQRTAADVANEIFKLLQSEYVYTTSDLCELFLCDRQWVEQTIRPNVKHILITYYFRKYLLSSPSLSDHLRDMLNKGFYFYSASDLQKFWRENAVAERKKKLIDLASYRNGCSVFELRNELDFHRSAKPCKRERIRHEEKMKKMLTETGFLIYQDSLWLGKEWYSTKLPELSREIHFTTLSETRRKKELHSNSVAMQHLLKAGAIRIKLRTRALWLLPDSSSLLIPIAVSAALK